VRGWSVGHYVYPDEQIRRRVDSQVYDGLAPDAFFILDIEAGIGLEAALQILSPESGRT
jgi:hypothetical protein